MNYKHIKYDGNNYTVFKVIYQNHSLPVIVNFDDFKKIYKMNKKWKCNQNGFIYCTHTHKSISRDIYLHELIMVLNNKSADYPIIHINKIGLDNRFENLMYDEPNKDTNKNIKKKKRTVELPKNSGIDPDTIPTYIWYVKPDETHGDRFLVDIGDFRWKTTSSKDIPLKQKLEEAKSYLKNLLKDNSQLVEEYSMNGDFTKEGKELLSSYYDIIHLAGFKNIERTEHTGSTFELLKPCQDNK